MNAPFPQTSLRFADAIALRQWVMKTRGVGLDQIEGKGQGRAVLDARQEIAFRLWTECPGLSLRDVARMIGRRDHSAAIHAILAGGRARGIDVARVSELRERPLSNRLDWTKLAYAAAGWRGDRTIEAAARLAGIGRVEWRKAEQGRAIAAETMLRMCRLIGLDPLSLLPVSHETPVKHEPAFQPGDASSRTGFGFVQINGGDDGWT